MNDKIKDLVMDAANLLKLTPSQAEYLTHVMKHVYHVGKEEAFEEAQEIIRGKKQKGSE